MEGFFLHPGSRQAFFYYKMAMAYRNILITLSALVLLGAMFSLGWWLGSRKRPVEVVSEKVRYVELPPITKVVEKPIPVREEIIVRDTVREKVEVVIPADTAGIVADYFKRRQYALDFSSDTIGVYKVQAVIACNRLESASATIQPLQREVERTVVKVRKFRPFAEVGVAIGDKVGASLGLGGIIKEKHIVSAKYMRIGNGNYYGAEYGYIFGK